MTLIYILDEQITPKATTQTRTYLRWTVTYSIYKEAIYISLDPSTTCCIDTNKDALSTPGFLAQRTQTWNVVTIRMSVCPKILMSQITRWFSAKYNIICSEVCVAIQVNLHNPRCINTVQSWFFATNLFIIK